MNRTTSQQVHKSLQRKVFSVQCSVFSVQEERQTEEEWIHGALLFLFSSLTER